MSRFDLPARSVHLFQGERFSPALGGSDVRGERVYEADKGRWRTADRYTPGVGDLSDRNRYVFVGADPVNHTDPTGMFSLTELNFNMGKISAKYGTHAGKLLQTHRNAREFMRVLKEARGLADKADALWDQVNAVRDLIDTWDGIEDLLPSLQGALGGLAHMDRAREVELPNAIERRLAGMVERLRLTDSELVEEFMGTFAGVLVAKAFGFENTDIVSRYHGIDGVLRHPNQGFLTLEAKGGRHAGLAPGQMSLRWMRDKAATLYERNQHSSSDAGPYLASVNGRRGHAAVVKLDFVRGHRPAVKLKFQVQDLGRMPDTADGGWGPGL